MKSDKKPTVISFGHLPRDHGGKQSSGLSYAIYEIAKKLSKKEKKFNYYLCASDVQNDTWDIKENKDGILIIGWNPKSLLSYGLKRPLQSLIIGWKSLKFYFQYSGKRGILNTLGIFLFYDAVINYYEPDLLHVHGSSRLLILDSLPSKKIPKVTTLHGVIGNDPNLPEWTEKREREALKRGDYFTFVSNKTAQTLEASYDTFPDNYKIIRNGIDLQKFKLKDRNKCRKELNLPRDRTIILTVGGYSKLKGQDRILEAYSKLKQQTKSDLCLVFVGKGVKEIDVEEFSETGCIRLFDHVNQEELIKFYNSADSHLSASSSEGFGMVMTESLACGTPVIVPKSCDIVDEDFIVKGENALIYENSEPQNIRRVILEAEELNFDRKIVRESVKGLKWGSIADEYISVFNRVAIK
mgnify:CR=1 FL=1